ncbi:MAG: O-antigen ligase family protein [Pseudotabrizicola sp.]|nr:O-antigen ligase family protein [Pseudotabrizicola sp.]
MIELTVILGAAGIVAVAVSLRWPMLAVFLFILLTLTNTPAILVHEHGLPSIGSLLVPALAALLFVRARWYNDQVSTAARLAPFVGLLFLSTALFIPWVQNTEATSQVASELGKNLVIMLVLLGFLTSIERVHWAARAVALAIGLLAIPSVYQSIFGLYEFSFWGYATAAYLHIEGTTQGWRLTGPMLDANFFAQLLLAGLPVTIALVFVERRWSLRVLAAIFAVAILFTIVQTFSRGALLALVVVAIAAVLLSPSRIFLLPVMLIGVLLTALLGPESVFERAFSGLKTFTLLLEDANITGDPAVIQRVSVMRAATRMFMENPVFGVGPGQFSTYYPDYAVRFGLDIDAPAAAHSLYLEIAAEQGILGLLIFSVFILGPLLYSFRRLLVLQMVLTSRETYLLRAMVLGVIGYLAAALLLHDAYPRFFWVFMALLIGTVSATNAAVLSRTSLSRSPEMSEQPQQNAAPAAYGRIGAFQKVLLDVLIKQRVAILLGAIVFSGLSAFQVATTPATFSTDAKLMYRFGREYFPITPTEVRRNWGENIIVSLDNALSTELHILSSHEVAGMTLERLEGPSQVFPDMGSRDPLTQGEQRAALLQLLEARRVQGTTMLSVRFKHSDPTMAEQLLSTHIEAYIDRRDMLMHADASGYFVTQYDALSAKDEAVQAELTRLRFERSELEAQGNVTSWNPDIPPDPDRESMAQLMRQILWIDGMIEQHEKRSDVFRTRLLELENVRQDWEMSQAYREQVGPNVEIADRTPVSKISTLSSSVAKVLTAAIGGALLIWALAFLLHTMGRRPALSVQNERVTEK